MHIEIGDIMHTCYSYSTHQLSWLKVIYHRGIPVGTAVESYMYMYSTYSGII